MTAAGYRLYGAAQLERLEQIAALRFVGFSLEQIKELLDGSHLPLAAALEMQRNLVARQKRRLESVLAALDEARLAIDGNEPGDPWATLRNVMEAFTVSNDWEWTKRYYSPPALERIEENRTRWARARSSRVNAIGAHSSLRSKTPQCAASTRAAMKRER